MTKPPSHLSAEAKRIWKELRTEYEIDDPDGLLKLRIACEAFDRAQKARKTIDKDGETVEDRWGQVKVHPACAVERDNRAAFLAALKSLGLQPELADVPGPGRPGPKPKGRK